MEPEHQESPEETTRRTRRNAALELGFNVGPAFAGLMWLGWFVGSRLDEWWGTAPAALSIGVILGAVSGFVYLIRVARRLE